MRWAQGGVLVAALGCDLAPQGLGPETAPIDPVAPVDSDQTSPDDTPSESDTEPPVAGPSFLTPAFVALHANLDDDDGDGAPDGLAPPLAADDDRAALGASLVAADAEATVRLALHGVGVRVVDAAGVLVADPSAPVAEVPAAALGGLAVEVMVSPAEGRVVLEALDAAGATLTTGAVEVRGAPLILNHHLQPTEEVWAVSVSGLLGDNGALIEGLRAALGPLFTEVPGRSYDGDVWFQDELEWATATSPAGRVYVVIDSVRDRGLDPWPEDVIGGPGELSVVFGRGRASSQDSFGNLEVSPPVTVDGQRYPFGRIYWGAAGGRYGPVQGLRDALGAQVVQAPFELDTSWLCVGHVDEFMTFIPDATAPKGFRLLYSDIDLARQILEGLDPTTRLPKYAPAWNGHGLATVGEIVRDRGLWAYNEDLRDQHLEPTLVQVQTELGLDEADVIRIPALFEAARGCFGSAAALIPAMANLLVVNPPGEAPLLVVPDPFFRADAADQASDPMIAALREAVPPGVRTVFLDNWDVYHLALGEVHCGTNSRRTPAGDWWTDAAALLGLPAPVGGAP